MTDARSAPWRQRLRAAVRGMPWPMRLTLGAATITFLRFTVSFLARAREISDVTYAIFGSLVAVHGMVLAVDVHGSAAATLRLGGLLRRRPIWSGPRTVRQVRVLGAVFVVVGLVALISVAAGFLRWRD